MSKKKHTYSVNVVICINDDFLVKADSIREAKLLASEKFKKKFLKEKNFEFGNIEKIPEWLQ